MSRSLFQRFFIRPVIDGKIDVYRPDFHKSHQPVPACRKERFIFLFLLPDFGKKRVGQHCRSPGQFPVVPFCAVPHFPEASVRLLCHSALISLRLGFHLIPAGPFPDLRI